MEKFVMVDILVSSFILFFSDFLKKGGTCHFYRVTDNTVFLFPPDTKKQKGGSGTSSRVLSPVTGRSRVRVVVSTYCTGEGKACH